MLGVEYSFILVPPTGTGFRRDITGLVTSFSAVRVVGARGACTLGLAPGLEDLEVVRDTRLIVERSLPQQPRRRLFETLWLLRRPAFDYESGAYRYEHKGYDLNDLAYRRAILYKSGTSQARKAGRLDDMIKAIARENMGSLATDTARDWSTYLRIQSDLSQAPAQGKAFAYRNQAEVFQELCQASAEDDDNPTYLAWDIVALTEALAELRTYTDQRGIDRRATREHGGLVFSPERGNVSRGRWSRDFRDEVTHVTAGGKGKGSRRDTEEKSNTTRSGVSPFGRIEDFVDARQADSTAELRAEAMARLREGRPTELLELDIQETPGCLFGVHFDLGDYATCELRRRAADVRLDAMTISVNVIADDQGNRGWTEELGIVARVEGDL